MEKELTLKELNEFIKFLEEQENWTSRKWQDPTKLNCYCVHGHICYNPKSPYQVSDIVGDIAPYDHIFQRVVDKLIQFFGPEVSLVHINDNIGESCSELSKEASPKERVLTLLYILQYEMEQERNEILATVVESLRVL
jgi:hypothetical protein